MELLRSGGEQKFITNQETGQKQVEYRDCVGYSDIDIGGPADIYVWRYEEVDSIFDGEATATRVNGYEKIEELRGLK